MSCLEGSHAPGSATAHLLPPAGIRNSSGDVFRYHRVIPEYPLDPSIGPTEAEIVCPPGGGIKNQHLLPPAGASSAIPSDRFAFHQARAGSTTRPCAPGTRTNAVNEPCPPTNSKAIAITRSSHAVPNPASSSRSPFGDRCQPNSTNQPQPTNALQSQLQWPSNSQRGGHAAQLQTNIPANDMQAARTYPQQLTSAYAPPNQQQAYIGPQQAAVVYPQPGQMLLTPRQQELIAARQYQGQVYCPFGQEPSPACGNAYIPSPYICKPVFDVRCLDDCPEQDGPPADSYTFL